MDDSITIIDRGTGEVVIEVRETFLELANSKTFRGSIGFFFGFTIFIFFLGNVYIPFITISFLIILFLLIPKTFYRKVRIIINPKGKAYYMISAVSYFQIAGFLNFVLSDQLDTFAYGVFASLSYEEFFKITEGDCMVTIQSPKNSDKRIKIIILGCHSDTLVKIVNKVLSSRKSKSVAESKIKQDAVLDVKNDNSLSIIDVLNAISIESSRITRINDYHIAFDKKILYEFNTFWHLFGGIFFVGLGLQIISFAALLAKPQENFRLVALILMILIFFLSTALIFRGVYIIVKRLITAVLRQVVHFDNTSQVVTLEEQFPIYKSTQKYFWEKAELSIEKPRNTKDYLEDKKVLVLTLQKAGQPAKRVELFKHENEQYLQQLREYIGEFYREQDISDTIR